MTFWTWAKVKIHPSLSCGGDVENLFVLCRALRTSSTARAASASRGSSYQRAPARSSESRRSPRTANSSHCRSAHRTKAIEPCTSSRLGSQTRRLCTRARNAACSRACPCSPSFTGSRTSVVCRPLLPVRTRAPPLPSPRSLFFFWCAGFLRQWPSLPTFGVFLTTRVLPVAHVDDGDRYVVSRVEALPGFSGVAQFLGFRDEAALRFEEIIARVSDIEQHFADAERDEVSRTAARTRVAQLMELARHPTHVYVPPPPPLLPSLVC